MQDDTKCQIAGACICSICLVGVILYFTFSPTGRRIGGAEPLQRLAKQRISREKFVCSSTMCCRLPVAEEVMPQQFTMIVDGISDAREGDFIIVYRDGSLIEVVGGPVYLAAGQTSVKVDLDFGGFTGSTTPIAWHRAKMSQEIEYTACTFTVTAAADAQSLMKHGQKPM